jgi:two-component system, NarL family, response regulator NreC
MKTTILLADDHEIFRQGLNMLLSAQPDFQVIGQAADGLQAVALAERLCPNIVIVDMLMPGLSGMDVVRQIKQRVPICQVIVLSMHDDESYVLTALQNGAIGYVLKDSSTADLVQAVRSAMAGQRFLSQPLTERAIQAYINQAQSSSGDYLRLTNREREVLHLAAEGLTNPEIAKRLTISVRTVETHRAHLMHKLGARSQEELVAFAKRKKLIP